MSLLDRLAEGLRLPRVNEQVEGGQAASQLLPGLHAHEDRTRQVGLEFGTLWTVPDDHQPNAGQIGERAQIFDLFLGSQASHEAHHDLAVRGPRIVQRLITLVGAEQLGVDASSPNIHP